MRAGVFVAGLMLLAAAGAPPGSGQITIDFNFDKLGFRFFPEGLGNPDVRGNGSGLQIQAHAIRIADENAIDLRHCIDGWNEPACSYGSTIPGVYKGDKDGEVEPPEVNTFSNLAEFIIDDPNLGIEKVVRLVELVKNNITVDGKNGVRPKVVDFVLRDAEGAVGSSATIFADVTLEVGFDNVPGATHHEIHVRGLHLDQEAFAYDTAQWDIASDYDWSFNRAETLPASAQGHVSESGWQSNQSQFESATDAPLRLSVDRIGDAAGGSTSWLLWVGIGAVVLAALSAVGFVLWRRRAP